MARRKLRRRLRFRAVRWAYRRAHALHRHEEQAVLALLVERGSGSVTEWCKREPGRFDPPYLRKTFARLYKRGLVTYTSGAHLFGRGERIYEPVPTKRRKAA